MVAHNFDPSIQEAEADGFLCVRVQPGLSSRTARARHRKPFLKTKNKKSEKCYFSNILLYFRSDADVIEKSCLVNP